MSRATKSSSAAKPATSKAKAKPAAAKAKAASAPPTSGIQSNTPAAKKIEPTVVNAPQAVIAGPMMRKKELVDLVVTRSGLKKKDVKPAIEMALVVLGEALRDNRELNLPPMGRLKVRREKQLPNGRMVVAKIRQNLPEDETDASVLKETASD